MAKRNKKPNIIIWDCPKDCTHGPYGTRSIETPNCDECGTDLVQRPEGLNGTVLSKYNFDLEHNHAANHHIISTKEDYNG